MELQDPVLRALSGIMTWAPVPRYRDLQGAIAEGVLDAMGGSRDDWDFQGPLTMVGNEGRKLHVMIDPNSCLVVSEDPSDGDAVPVLAECLHAALGVLEAPSIFSMGSRSTWLTAASSSEDAAEWLETRVGSGLRRMFDPLGGKPTGLGLRASFGGEPSDWDLELRTMSAAQAAEGSDFIDEEEGNYPPSSLFVEVSRDRIELDLSPSDAITRWREDLERNVEAAGTFHRLLMEEES